MNERTEKKLSDLSGMNRAIGELLQQAWERGRKYGNEEKKDIERPIKGIAKTDENGKIKIELLIPQEAEWIIDTITRDTICSRCRQSRRDTRTEHIYYCNHCGARMITASEGKT